LASGLVGGVWSTLSSGSLTLQGRAQGSHWVGFWVGPRAGLDENYLLYRDSTQPVASCYTDCAIPDLTIMMMMMIIIIIVIIIIIIIIIIIMPREL
jgi:hypothetical protein